MKHGFSQASYNALTTLVFVAPAAVLPRVLDQLKADIDTATLNGISAHDLAVWATPEGTTYVDGKILLFYSSALVLTFSQFFPGLKTWLQIKERTPKLPSGKTRSENLWQRKKQPLRH